MIIQVWDGRTENTPIEHATVVLHHAAAGATTDQAARTADTGPGGVAALDTVLPAAYELLIRRVGWQPVRVPLTVRQGASDTVEVTTWPQLICES